MPLDNARTRQLLKTFDLKGLFIEELGWDRCGNQLEITLDGMSYSLSAVAEKHGMVAFICNAPLTGLIPDYSLRRKVERQAAKSAHEHIIIYTDRDKTTQVWQWVKRESGKPTACREHTFHITQDGLSLVQKLQSIAFRLEEEETLTIFEVGIRARAAFDVERITKRFYDRFKTEHDVFLKFIYGIPDSELQRWYASVMLNRLMFIYFIQKKGFLSGDEDYLKNKLQRVKERGKDRFYKNFLSPLFFDGFAKKERDRSDEINKLLGEVPYLNGGLFLKHQIEELHGKNIEIADKAFEKLFDFFDQYQWHLDERPLKRDNEINPDVLGYIFEKYINQKQMGAYYTKEDITEYISKNTVIPFLFDIAGQQCKIAFEGSEQSVWRLLQTDPNRYFYPAVKKGIELPLPQEIAAGVQDVSKRTDWNRPAPPEYALPTETWREIVLRRRRCEEIKMKMLLGEIQTINDFITCNLDIRQFAQDVIWNSEGPELLRAFYYAIEKVTVLDPTCGSGAFLFAALNILEPLYEACLDRMQVFIEELDRSNDKDRPDKYNDFRKILKGVSDHPNLKYFIFKSIIVNNLYGVDIMEEAIEICKLRLFLKLVSQIDKADYIEPLPDIDFNIRSGNTLVGFTTYGEVEKATEGDWIRQQALPAIKEKAEDVDRLFQLFHKQQTELKGEAAPGGKEELKSRLKALEDELNQYLAGEYGINPSKEATYGEWLNSHKPFHWFIEFYGILKNGGFDVIIGNPPYVEYKDIRGVYEVRNYLTEQCSNLFAFVLERCTMLSRIGSEVGMIIPLSAFSTDRMTPLIRHLKDRSGRLNIAYFSWRPGKLFDGVNLQLSILLQKVSQEFGRIETTRYLSWDSEARAELFSKIEYVAVEDSRLDGSIPKLGSKEAASILTKLRMHKKELVNCFTRISDNKVFYRRGGLYWKVFVDFETGSSEEKIIHLMPGINKYSVIAVLSSDLWWWYFTITSDCRHLGNRDFNTFPFDPIEMTAERRALLSTLGKKYVKDLEHKAQHAVRVYKGKKAVECLSFRVNQSKPIIDEIDRVLAQHYGFTHEELDFIINYDIKYRMGRDNEEEN